VPHPPTPEIILQAALEIPGPQARAAYLNEACGGEQALRAEVGSLITAHLAAETFMHPLTEPLWRELPGEKKGDTIGRYTLIQQIGEAGFGTVEVYWKQMDLALLSGINGHLHMPWGHGDDPAQTHGQGHGH